jgi:ubiquinone/menaquinone biosynthesis C-methylase UbiE
MQSTNPQQGVINYFESSATYWKSVYASGQLTSAIYRARHNTALRWVRKIGLPVGARVLDIGCGAGLVTVALSRQGHSVDAMDAASAMLEMTRTHAVRHRVGDRVRLHLGDVHSLNFAANTFDIVIALGVLPWLHSEEVALHEMNRVLKPGGYLLVTADNNARLNRMFDPLSCPVFKPLRATAKHFLELCGAWTPPSGFQSKRHYPRELNRLIASCGFETLKSCTLGFGPFTVFGKKLFEESTSIQLHRSLQMASTRLGLYPLRWTGSHYVVLARKNESLTRFNSGTP